MYALLFALLIAVAGITPMNAQEKASLKLHYGAGYFSFPDFLGVLLVGFGSLEFSEEESLHRNFVPLINPNVELEYYFNEHVSLGGHLSLGMATANRTFEENPDNFKKATAVYPSLMVSSSTHYLQKEKFSLYGHWGVGATLFFFRQVQSDKAENPLQCNVFPAANIYPICLSYGKKHAVKLELGWGSKGFANIGGSILFSSR